MSSSEFMPGSKKIDELVNGATSFEELRESMKAQLASDGKIARDSFDGARMIPQPQDASRNANGQIEKILELPNGRKFKLEANTPEEIAMLEDGVRRTKS